AYVADCRSAQRPDSAADAGGSEYCGWGPEISSRVVAIDGDLQERGGGLQGLEIRSRAFAAARRTGPAIQHHPHESQRWSGGQFAGGALPDRRASRNRNQQRENPPDRANARPCRDLLRRRSGERVATQHRHEREPAPASTDTPVVRRLARSLGGQYAGGRRDELQSQDRLPGFAAELASGRALDTDGA